MYDTGDNISRYKVPVAFTLPSEQVETNKDRYSAPNHPAPASTNQTTIHPWLLLFTVLLPVTASSFLITTSSVLFTHRADPTLEQILAKQT
jgi:hypothetical protein